MTSMGILSNGKNTNKSLANAIQASFLHELPLTASNSFEVKLNITASNSINIVVRLKKDEIISIKKSSNTISIAQHPEMLTS